MAGSLNKVVLIGNVGKDPEIININDNKEIANFTLATSESWKDKSTGEKKEKTEWHYVVVFNEGLVRVVKEYVKKGSKVYIEGQLQTSTWIDKQGQEKSTTKIVLQNFNSTFILLDNRGGAAGRNSVTNSDNNVPNFDNSELDDEIPF